MKAKERLLKYGIKAYLKMRGLKKTPSRIFYYLDKYPAAKLELPAKAPSISYHMKSYWKDVKLIAEGHEISIKKARKILKREREDRTVRVRVTRTGKKWQLHIFGKFKNAETGEITEAEGFSLIHDTRNEHEEALNEAINSAIYTLGGATFGDGGSGEPVEDSDWELVKITKETWYRYYGRIPE